MTTLMHYETMSSDEVAQTLAKFDILATSQRVDIAQALLSHGGHFSADEVFALVNASGPRVSKATVYNTLGLFSERGLVRQVIVDPARVFYDVNTHPHYHFFDCDTGKLTDIQGDQMTISGIPNLPEGSCLDRVDVIVRVRRPAAEHVLSDKVI
jgi:Fur family iron response transcriptional regulator